eukprot:scaffold274501_cov30-Tisochrysis_lutea.AAC.2
MESVESAGATFFCLQLRTFRHAYAPRSLQLSPANQWSAGRVVVQYLPHFALPPCLATISRRSRQSLYKGHSGARCVRVRAGGLGFLCPPLTICPRFHLCYQAADVSGTCLLPSGVRS